MSERSERPSDPGEQSPDLAAIQRWADSGAIWRVIARTDDRVIVGLYECTGGTEMDRIASSDPELLRYLDGRSTNAD